MSGFDEELATLSEGFCPKTSRHADTKPIALDEEGYCYDCRLWWWVERDRDEQIIWRSIVGYDHVRR